LADSMISGIFTS